MKHYCNPMNLEYRYQFYRSLNPQSDEQPPFQVYREAADPSLILFKETYYLFPSMTVGFFTSEDMKEWKFHEFLGDIPIYDYAPDIRAVGEYLYFSASHMGEPCDFYRSRDPRKEPFEKIKGTFPFWDPNLFQDEDGRVYFYWGCSNITPIYGVEMNPETMVPLTEPVSLFDSHAETRGYERRGEEHVPPKTEEQIEAEVENMLEGIKKQAREQGTDLGMEEGKMREMLRGNFGNRPYIEGPWMTKYKNCYYLQYAIPGTECNVYGDGVYISKSPLGPFESAKNNPYSYKPGGFITGAGHGSTIEDKYGEWWHTASMRISHNQGFERRLGLWKAGFDSDGELYCDQRFGDWPIAFETKAFAQPDWMLLSYGCPVKVSSGTGAENVTDENIRTFWKADTNSAGGTVTVDLKEVKEVSAIQVNFADDGYSVAELSKDVETAKSFYEERWIDPKKQVTRWMLEGSEDGNNYQVLCDKRKADTDYSHDFIELEKTLKLQYIRLNIEKVPYDQPACIAGIRIFGRGNDMAPNQAADVKAVIRENGMDMDVSWSSNSIGANILWGYAPDKLYHSRMVYGAQKGLIGALVKDQAVFIRIDTFNDSGITEGEVFEVRTVTIKEKNDRHIK